MIASAVRFVPDFREQTIETDMFTPTTIRRFTWHDYGAVYGMPEKRTDGTTPYQIYTSVAPIKVGSASSAA